MIITRAAIPMLILNVLLRGVKNVMCAFLLHADKKHIYERQGSIVEDRFSVCGVSNVHSNAVQ